MDKETAGSVQKLIGYLPKFQTEPFYGKHYGLYQTYAPYVDDFFEVVRLEFCNHDYAQKGMAELEKLLNDDGYISTASIEELKDLLTLCLRGERFVSGFIGECIENKRIELILNRLAVLYEST